MQLYSVSCSFAVCELALIQVRVEALLCHQRIVRSLFQHISLIHHQDPVCTFDRGKTVSNDKTGLTCHQLFKCLLDPLLRPQVDAAGGFVQNQERRVCQHDAGNAEQLLLSL